MKSNRLLFNMEECLKERSTVRSMRPSFVKPLTASIAISGVDNLSRFRTRVVLNEVLDGESKELAVKKALSIHSKKGE